MTVCEVKNCRKTSDINWLGHQVCNDCWSKHCDNNISLYEEFGVKNPGTIRAVVGRDIQTKTAGKRILTPQEWGTERKRAFLKSKGITLQESMSDEMINVEFNKLNFAEVQTMAKVKNGKKVKVDVELKCKKCRHIRHWMSGQGQKKNESCQRNYVCADCKKAKV